MGGAIATFDYAGWQARYPEFNAIGQATAQQYFNEAGLYWRNDGTGPVCNPTSQDMFMKMVMAHLAALYSQAQGDPSPGSPKDPNTPVGRIASASEGSVSVSTENPYPPGSAQWFQQTKYGASFWQATAAYRRFRPRIAPGADPSKAGLFNTPGF